MTGPNEGTEGRDVILNEVREVVMRSPLLREDEALIQISTAIENEIRSSSVGAAVPGQDVKRAGRRRERRRLSRGVVAIALVGILAASGTLAVAQTGALRGIFTDDTPSTERMQAFRVSPTPTGSDNGPTVPREAQERIEMLWGTDGGEMRNQYGDLAPRADARTVLSGTWKGRAVSIYARATTKGNACYTAELGSSTGVVATCVGYFFDLDAPLQISGSVKSGRAGIWDVRLYGLAADEVAGVSVRLEDGTATEALMGTNAFYWDDAGAPSAPESIIVEFTDGHIVTQPIEKYVGETWGD